MIYYDITHFKTIDYTNYIYTSNSPLAGCDLLRRRHSASIIRMNTYIYIYIYIICTYTYIYIYIERERDRYYNLI